MVFADTCRFDLGAGESAHRSLGTVPDGAFIIEGSFDPSLRTGGDLQSVAAIILGWEGSGVPETRSRNVPSVAFEIREGNGMGFWEVWIDGINETLRQPNPKPPGWAWDGKNQQPHHFSQRDGPYPFKLVAVPRGNGQTDLKFYVLHFDRPVAEHRVSHRLAELPFYSHGSFGGKGASGNLEVSLSVRGVSAEELPAAPSPRDLVLGALDLEHPDLAEVAASIRGGDPKRAGRLFLEHLATRESPRGPSLDEFGELDRHVEIADHSAAGRYGTLGWFSEFAPQWKGSDGTVHSWILPNGTVNWARDKGHLNRHFHWVSYGFADRETGDPKYGQRLSFEVQDWVSREPFYWDRCPEVGGVNLMDGTVFTKGYMNTSNIGRRCELTWWYAWEAFRNNPAFDDDGRFAMLLGFLRQSRLLMNPSSFAAHDDGGAHSSMALLQNGLMLPEFSESAAWRERAMAQWDAVLKVQFYPDGSHVSGSTGYNWASIMALENFIALMKRTGTEIPARFTRSLAKGLEHPIGISRPDQGQVDMNDGGWSMVDDHYARVVNEIFPDREDFRWMATRGKEGHEPSYRSIQFPHSGHLIQRTGWGPDEKYFFMDAGALGASHGKNDKLNIYLALGPHQLISSGGRGSYDANPFSAYAGSTYGYNTILVDDLPQQRIHIKHSHTGHVPEKRRWITGKHFDYCEGFYRYGWFGSAKHVPGVHTREVIMVKGDKSPESTFWIVLDTVEFTDDEEHEIKAVFHSRRDAAEIDPETKVFTCLDRAAGFRILPGQAAGLSLRNARGQMEPYIQGWHVVGKNRAPMHTGEYAWTARGKTTRAWILEARVAAGNWSVGQVRWNSVEGGVGWEITHLDGRKDLVERLETENGSRLTIVSSDTNQKETARLTIEPGDE